ncbi:LacI family DNA-binding transcriptional regulator [Actinocorallia longicatena]|uniref:LacI family DNA-binding transcriptional regulator n=1 Tax=Actinocorallia longicatena TaxID=111803 RepID=A0ABP6QBF8_9ACTN
MAVTIRDVARTAGVHVSTVSRTFSAPHLVNPETRVRVLAVAEELGYRPNRAARALTTGRTGNLGLIVADIANPFFPPLIKSAQAHARERDYHVFVADTDEDPRVEEELIRTFAKQVDGLLLCSPRLSGRAIDRLNVEIPFVVVNRQVKGLSTVLMDVAQGARSAVEHLLRLGHRRIALLAGPSSSWNSSAIEEAAASAALAGGAELAVLGPNPPTEQGGELAAAEVLRSGATGVLAYNDLIAIGLIEALDELGVAVPGQLSVVGFDDIMPARVISPKLTTVAMPTVAAGRAAVDALLRLVESPATGTTRTTLDTSLVVRASTAAAPSPAVARPR